MSLRARKFWKKLSISVVAVNKKLRRLSSVGSHDFTEGPQELTAAALLLPYTGGIDANLLSSQTLRDYDVRTIWQSPLSPLGALGSASPRRTMFIKQALGLVPQTSGDASHPVALTRRNAPFVSRQLRCLPRLRRFCHTPALSNQPRKVSWSNS